MTHQPHPNVTRQVVQLLSEQGFEGMAEAMQRLLNECMPIERQQALGVGPYQRSEARRGQANGFKPKTVKTRIGPLALRMPQVRGAEFYPRALERGTRSEKALRLALAEMYRLRLVRRKKRSQGYDGAMRSGPWLRASLTN
jgi:putative transposase